MLRAFGGYLFPGIPEASLGELVDAATVESFGKDAVVFKEGDKADAFYLIRNGMVKISKKSGDKEVVLSYLVLGDAPGSKYEKAKSLGVKIIGEEELKKLAG